MKKVFYITLILLGLSLSGYAQDISYTSIEDAKVYADASEQINVIVGSYNPSDDIIATLHTVTGRKLDSQVLWQGQAIFPSESLIGSGLYIVTLRSGPTVKSHKISIK
jgi:hypothetical protein